MTTGAARALASPCLRRLRSCAPSPAGHRVQPSLAANRPLLLLLLLTIATTLLVPRLLLALTLPPPPRKPPQPCMAAPLPRRVSAMTVRVADSPPQLVATLAADPLAPAQQTRRALVPAGNRPLLLLLLLTTAMTLWLVSLLLRSPVPRPVHAACPRARAPRSGDPAGSCRKLIFVHCCCWR